MGVLSSLYLQSQPSTKPPNLDDQHHNVLEANNPHPPTEEGGDTLKPKSRSS